MRKLLSLLTILILLGSLAPVGFDFSKKPKLEIKKANAASINIGDGTDGTANITTAKNINTDLNSGLTNHSRSCADGGDGVNYSVSAISGTRLTVSAGPSAGCLANGDEVMLINLKGTSGDYGNVGNYEFLTVSSIDSGNHYVNLNSAPTKTYSDPATQKIMVQRVPNYTDVTISGSGTLTATAWNGTKGGVIAFRASETVTVNDTTAAKEIDVQGLGYTGGTGVASDANAGGGEAYNGTGGTGGSSGSDGNTGQGGGGGGGYFTPSGRNGVSGAAGNGGGGGGGTYLASGLNGKGGGGGGGGYGSIGVGGSGGNSGQSGSGTTGGQGGNGSTSGGGGGGGGSFGNSSQLNQKIYLGSGGAAGGGSYRQSVGGVNGANGGNGGGIAYLSVNNTIIITNASIKVDGAAGLNGVDQNMSQGGGGGGGSGGSIAVFSNYFTNSGNITANNGSGGLGGGSSATNAGGNGGGGRTYVQYGSFSGNNPTPNYYSSRVDMASISQTSDTDFNGDFGSPAQTAVDTGNGRVRLGIEATAFNSTGYVHENPTSSNDTAFSTAVDSGYIYTAGFDRMNNSDIHIEKRNKITGALCDGVGNCAAGAFNTTGIIQESSSGGCGGMGADCSSSITVDSNYIYIGTIDASPGNLEWRIEKRNKNTGALCNGVGNCAAGAFNTTGIIQENIGSYSDNIFSVIVDSDYIYLAGSYGTDGLSGSGWRIEKRNIATGALCNGVGNCAAGAFNTTGIIQEGSSNYTRASSVAIDSNYVYLAGYENATSWRIEKRNIATGALCDGIGNCTAGAFDTDGIVQENGLDKLFSIAIDSGYIYLGGAPSAYNWRVEKRNIVSGALCNGVGNCAAGAFDSDGIFDESSISGCYSYGFKSIKVDNSYVYLGGSDCFNSNDSEWRVEKRDKISGASVSAFNGTGIIQENISSGGWEWDDLNSIAIDSGYLYLVGGDSVETSIGDNGWRIEKRNITSGAFMNYTAYYSSGSYTSTIFQRQQVASWGNLTYTTSGTGTVGIKVKTCANNDCSDKPGWTCGDIFSGSALTSGSPNCVSDNEKYIQYQATLGGDTTTTPYLESITLDYFYNPDTSIMSGVVKFFGSIIFK